MLSPRPSTLCREGFVAAYGGIYEHSAWIAEAAFDRGLGPAHDAAAGLAAAMAAVVEAAGRPDQLALLGAHPELAGRLAMAGELTERSRAEQAGAGLDQCTPEEFARFGVANAAYGERFGFPFIIAVKGLARAEILAALEARATSDPAAEFRTALDQVHKIARLRLEAMDGASDR
jgi:OHCU decarboxylase